MTTIMRISILTLFPELFVGPFDHSIIKRAREKNLVDIQFVNIRDFGVGKHKIVDDRPFGGGAGMVMKVDVIDAAITATKNPQLTKQTEQVILLDARGKTYTQQIAQTLASLEHIILICGHYEGVDERVRTLVDQTISIGDFILTGGEIPTMLIVDSVTRLLPGVLKKDDATVHESFSINHASHNKLLEYPQYTMPREYKGNSVPEILLSGNHGEIENWRKEQANSITKAHRPDLLDQ